MREQSSASVPLAKQKPIALRSAIRLSAYASLRRDRSRAKTDSALRRARAARRENGSVRRMAHAGAIHRASSRNIRRVRNNVGIFDISHMGQLIAEGQRRARMARTRCSRTTSTSSMSALGQYTFLLNERGGIIDDLIVYRIGEQKFLLVVNASRTDEDFAWLQQASGARRSSRLSKIAAQILAESRFKGRASADISCAVRQNVDLPARNHIVDLPIRRNRRFRRANRLHRRRRR